MKDPRKAFITIGGRVVEPIGDASMKDFESRTVSADPQLYFATIPTLLAIAGNMTWEQYKIELDKKDVRPNILGRCALRAGLNTPEGVPQLAFAVVETIINAYQLTGADAKNTAQLANAVLQESVKILQARIPALLAFGEEQEEEGFDLG